METFHLSVPAATIRSAQQASRKCWPRFVCEPGRLHGTIHAATRRAVNCDLEWFPHTWTPLFIIIPYCKVLCRHLHGYNNEDDKLQNPTLILILFPIRRSLAGVT